jgi:S1-C subfamily serine protease
MIRFNSGLAALVVSLAVLSSVAGRAQCQPPPAGTIVPPAHDKKDRPFLGVACIQTERGALIVHVIADSPAAKLGLERGDRILEIDGYEVGMINGLSFTIESELRRARGPVTLKVWDLRRNKDVIFAGVNVGGSKSPGKGGLPDDESDRLAGRK